MEFSAPSLSSAWQRPECCGQRCAVETGEALPGRRLKEGNLPSLQSVAGRVLLVFLSVFIGFCLGLCFSSWTDDGDVRSAQLERSLVFPGKVELPRRLSSSDSSWTNPKESRNAVPPTAPPAKKRSKVPKFEKLSEETEAGKKVVFQEGGVTTNGEAGGERGGAEEDGFLEEEREEGSVEQGNSLSPASTSVAATVPIASFGASEVDKTDADGGEGDAAGNDDATRNTQPSDGKKHRIRKRKRVLDPQTFRKELCDLFKTNDKELNSWFALMVLYVAEWPSYARQERGGERFLHYLKSLAENFRVPDNATPYVRKRFLEEIACGTHLVFLKGLEIVAPQIRTFQDLFAVLKKHARDPDFHNLVEHTQVSKLPVDVSVAGFAMLLRTAFEGFAFSFSRRLFLKNSPKGNLSKDELYTSVVEQYHQNQLQYWMLLLMANVMKRIVSRRPHVGIMVLKVEAVDEAVKRSTSSYAAAGGEPLRGALDSVQHQVASSMAAKLEWSLIRFQHLSAEQGLLTTASAALHPSIFVTGMLRLTQSGTFLEDGVFGMELEADVLEELKASMVPGTLLIEVTLVDPWSFKPPTDWPDPLQRDVLALTAYTATQLLCAELQWDPSLGSLGLVKVVFTGFSDVYSSSGSATQPRARFDPDVQILLMRDNQKFIEDGQEEGSKARIVNLVAQEPLQWGSRRVIDAERIQWRGIARLIKTGQVYRKNAFGMGLPLPLRRRAEEMLEPNVVLIHVAIRGLGQLTPETMGFEMTASEMASRLVRRSRGTYDSILLKSEVPVVKEAAIALDQRCGGELPGWVVLVSTLCVAFFFLIVITLLMYHRKLHLPWWIGCVFSNRSPWEPSPSVGSFAGMEVTEVAEKTSNSTRDLIAFAPPSRELVASLS